VFDDLEVVDDHQVGLGEAAAVRMSGQLERLVDQHQPVTPESQQLDERLDASARGSSFATGRCPSSLKRAISKLQDLADALVLRQPNTRLSARTKRRMMPRAKPDLPDRRARRDDVQVRVGHARRR
jgi:hypothetical protein